MTRPESDAGGRARPKVRVAVVTTEPTEPPREADPVALADATGQPDVLPGAVDVALGGRFTSEVLQPVGPLGRDARTQGDAGSVKDVPNPCRVRGV